MITVLDAAIKLGAKRDARGSITASEFDRLGLPFLSGCVGCGASLGPHNAYPTRRGFIACRDCVGEEDPTHSIGFETVRAWRRWERQRDDPRRLKRFERKAGQHDMVHVAYNLGEYWGWRTRRKHPNPYPPGRRHDEFNRGFQGSRERW